jgi:hypothetical protein
MTAATRDTRRFSRSITPASVAFALLATACGGGSSVTGPTTPPPATATPGWLTVQLDTPRSDDGAVQLLVTGPGIDSVKAVGYDGYAEVVSGEANLLVTGSVGAGMVAQVKVPDVARLAEYHASIVAAAARTTYVLQDLTGYRAVLVR